MWRQTSQGEECFQRSISPQSKPHRGRLAKNDRRPGVLQETPPGHPGALPNHFIMEGLE